MPKYEAFINLFVLYDYFLPSIPIFILLVFFSKFSHNLRYLNLLFYLFMYYFIIFSYTNFRAYRLVVWLCSYEQNVLLFHTKSISRLRDLFLAYFELVPSLQQKTCIQFHFYLLS
jgi:hypothetical protein